MTTAPADTNAAATYTLDTRPCSRCGGSGHHSYNQVHGTTCFGCSGSGKAYTPAAKRVLVKLGEHLKAIGLGRRVASKSGPAAYECTPGTDGFLVGRMVSDGKFFRVVTAVVLDRSRGCGWSNTGGAPLTAENASAWHCTITFADGTTIEETTNSVLRCRMSPAEAAARRAIFAAHVGKGVSIAEPVAPAAAAPVPAPAPVPAAPATCAATSERAGHPCGGTLIAGGTCDRLEDAFRVLEARDANGPCGCGDLYGGDCHHTAGIDYAYETLAAHGASRKYDGQNDDDTPRFRRVYAAR